MQKSPPPTKTGAGDEVAAEKKPIRIRRPLSPFLSPMSWPFQNLFQRFDSAVDVQVADHGCDHSGPGSRCHVDAACPRVRSS